MTATKDILNLANTIQAANLVGQNLKQSKKKKQSAGDIVGLGMKNVVGTSFIKINADLIGGL
jgi:hypothetical protein